MITCVRFCISFAISVQATDGGRILTSLGIRYGGWVQCRLATDRDDYNEPRGRFGWTFAFDGEPDLDRVIRFHDPPSLRGLGCWPKGRDF